MKKIEIGGDLALVILALIVGVVVVISRVLIYLEAINGVCQ
jgi:hypothetical protein